MTLWKASVSQPHPSDGKEHVADVVKCHVIRAPHAKGMLMPQVSPEAKPVKPGVFWGTRAREIITPLKGFGEGQAVV